MHRQILKNMSVNRTNEGVEFLFRGSDNEILTQIVMPMDEYKRMVEMLTYWYVRWVNDDDLALS